MGADLDQPGPVLERNFARTYGDGSVKECLSIDLSAWGTSPAFFYNKLAKECTPDQIFNEIVGRRLRKAIPRGDQVLKGSNIDSYFIDPAITGLATPQVANDEPAARSTGPAPGLTPASRHAIPNLVLAGDYVRADVNLATMEGAYEAAPQAVNAILEANGLDARRAARSGRCASPRRSRPPRRSTSCAGSSSTARPSRRCGVTDERRAGADRAAVRPASCGSGRCSGVDAAETGGRAARSSSASPNASTGPSAPCALDSSGERRARRPGHEVGGERVPVAARRWTSATCAAGVVGLGDDVRLAAGVVPASGPSASAASRLARELERLAHARQPRGDRADRARRPASAAQNGRTSRGRRSPPRSRG